MKKKKNNSFIVEDSDCFSVYGGAAASCISWDSHVMASRLKFFHTAEPKKEPLNLKLLLLENP